MTASPRVSVLMPVYNAERHVREATASILAQTFGDFEFLIMDDGSTDATAALLNEFGDPRIRRITFPANRGYVAALNEGLDLARGEFIARQDADDVSAPERLAEEVRAMDADPSLAIVGSAYETIDEAGRMLALNRPPATDTRIRWSSLFHTSFAHTSVLFRASALGSLPLRYDPALRPAEDFALWNAVLMSGKGRNLPAPLVKYRIHSAQVSQQEREERARAADAICRACLRRIGIDLNGDAIAVLRQWQREFPRKILAADHEKCSVLLRIFSEFAKLPGLDPADLAEIRRELALKILGAIPKAALPAFLLSEAGRAIISADPGAMPDLLARKAKRQINRLGGGRRAHGK